MKSSLLPFVETRLRWAGEHEWAPGERTTSMAHGPTLWLVLEGEIYVAFSGQKWRVGAGEAFLSPPGVSRELETPDGARWLSAAFEVWAFRQIELLEQLPLPAHWRPDASQRETLTTALRFLASAFVPYEGGAPKAATLSRDQAVQIGADGAARLLWSLCWKQLAQNEVSQAVERRAPEWLERALLQLRENPAISMADWAKATGFSPAQFRRHFQNWFALSPQAYANRYCLERAGHLLRTTNLSTQTIGEQLGFFNASHFARAFKRAYGMSPTRYRQSVRETSV